MNNNVVITLRTTEEIKQKLDKIALEDNRSLNNLINVILIKYLEDKKISKWKLKDFLANMRVSKISEVILHKMLAPKISYILFAKLFSFLN